MSAAVYNFEVLQGTSLVKSVVWKNDTGTPVNLTGYTAKMQVRETADSEDVLLELSTALGNIQITPAQGKVTLIFSPDDTSGAYWTRGRYDLELTSGTGFVTRLIQGKFSLSKEITRD
jgi:hypothetical protein